MLPRCAAQVSSSSPAFLLRGLRAMPPVEEAEAEAVDKRARNPVERLSSTKMQATQYSPLALGVEAPNQSRDASQHTASTAPVCAHALSWQATFHLRVATRTLTIKTLTLQDSAATEAVSFIDSQICHSCKSGDNEVDPPPAASVYADLPLTCLSAFMHSHRTRCCCATSVTRGGTFSA
ncbi:MAG: hypothetical protein ACPIOQ_07415 [Promethearchaeia archaeon]